MEQTPEGAGRSPADPRGDEGVTAPIDGGAPGATPAPGPRVGGSIGPYRLLSVLGEGGFGVVYLAERREPMVQRVALKVIKPGMDSNAVLARFEQERQALAVMDHPHVARVFDAGATADGRPYFVMELVQGEPITAYCDRNNLSIRERLELFVPVCGAVQHAHHKGIIHRDLKPSNILVAVQDARPLPKVIDFGVAKATSRTLTDRTVFTEQGQIIGTPEYMSPEQAEMGAVDVDTRTDVYGLGVVLYELLTGALPFDPRTLRAAGYYEIQRIIREVDPPRPSTRISALGEMAAEAARRRRSRPQDLERELGRELEWIPLKAMRKDRTRRYATPADLARDIGRYLDGMPLEAGPESAWYRARKAARRHRGAVIGAGAVAASLLVGAVVSARLASLEAAQRRRAETALAAAALERDVALAVSDFLVEDLLGSPDPELDGPGVRVVSVLDRAAPALGTRLSSRPEVRARLAGALGRAYVSVGRPDAAVPILTEARSLYAGRPGSAADLEALERTLGEALWRAASAEEAVRLLSEQVAALTAARPADDPALLDAQNQLAGALKHAGRLEEAQRAYGDVLERRTRVLGPEHADTLITAYNLALIPLERGKALAREGKGAEAAAAYGEALALMEPVRRRAAAALGAEHPVTLPMESELASLLNRLERLDEAREAYERALPAMRRVLGAGHFRTLETMVNLARLHQKAAGDAAAQRRAAALYEEALAGYRAEGGAASEAALFVTRRLAEACEALGEKGRAVWLLERAYEEMTAAGTDAARLASHAGEIASLCERCGDAAGAAAWRARGGTP